MAQLALSHPSDADEDLSSFILLFKRTITTSELLSLTLQKNSSALPALRTLSQISEQLQQLSRRQALSAALEIEPMTFSRFLYRLIEIIANCKIKYQYTAATLHDQSLERFLKEAEAVVRSGRDSEARTSFASIIALTNFILLQFATKIIDVFDGGGAGEDDEACREMLNKIREELTRVREIERRRAPRVFFLIASPDQSRHSEECAAHDKEPFQLLSSQTFSDMRKRFDNYVGMDLDFPFFRTSYFDAKTHYDAFYADYLARNTPALASIDAYEGDFQDYTKKRETRTLRKGNAANLDKAEKMSLKQQIRSIHATNETDSRMGKAVPRATSPYGRKLNDRAAISMSVNQAKIKRQQANLRTHRHPREVKENSESDHFNKKQFHPNHQYLLSGFTQKAFRTFEIDHLSRDPQKSLLRMRTEADKQKAKKQGSLSEEGSLKGPGSETAVRGLVVSSAKASLKTKYFEMKWMPEVLQETLRNRLMFNHKFCIKHANRNKSRNWLDRKLA